PRRSRPPVPRPARTPRPGPPAVPPQPGHLPPARLASDGGLPAGVPVGNEKLTGVLVAQCATRQGQDPGARLFNGLGCHGRAGFGTGPPAPVFPRPRQQRNPPPAPPGGSNPSPAPRRTIPDFRARATPPPGDIWLFRSSGTPRTLTWISS